jgi:hypothetical protein
MTEAHILHWIQHSALGELMRRDGWLFPACQALHFIGMSLLFGAIGLVDVRILGYFKSIPIPAVLKLIPIAIAGFVLNLSTGAAFFASNPYQYWPSPMFKLKMAVIIWAGVNALYFTFAEHRKLAQVAADFEPDFRSRVLAGTSIVFWLIVILAGRLLPTFEGSTSFLDF